MPDQKERYESWGRYPRLKHAGVVKIKPGTTTLPFQDYKQPLLAYAQGRSYGDSCLNENGILLDTSLLTGITAFDKTSGILRCDAGTTLADILQLIVPHGWFLPVTPGTKHVSVGGAIAHDVHGKNHHCAGTFGCYVKQFELLRSSGERLRCSPSENADLFRATIAGMGLTGIILWAEFQLKPIKGPFIEVERLPFATLEEFVTRSKASDQNHEYTVAWLDGFSGAGQKFGRGILTRGNHADIEAPSPRKTKNRSTLRVPFDAPEFLLNRITARAFNSLYYKMQSRASTNDLILYEPFFYPLDVLSNWNRIYGRRGFLQYQCVVPFTAEGAIEDIFGCMTRGYLAPFLVVLKTFGGVSSPGMLSFPRPGITLAMDFPFLGEATLKLFEEFDGITRSANGAVYPAKDACMSPQSFQTYFPQWKDFAAFIDPQFSSSFWRRVTASSG
jgi:FAD/FMN-containing dehydrogenase